MGLMEHLIRPFAGTLSVLLLLQAPIVRAADESTSSPESGAKADQSAETKSKIAPEFTSDDKVRNFYQVLEDILADFEFDLKNNEVKGLKDAAIRNLATSENVPESFKSHLEQLVTERILQNAKTRLIQCLPCRAKRAKLSGDNMIITSPESNPAELTRIAETLNVLHFMDVAFSYQPAGMLLSITVVDSESGSLVWSRSYNSETSRASSFRRGVDYSQIDEARRQTEYDPTILYRPTIYYFYEKDINGYAGNLVPGFRIVERYDNRKKEVGFELNYILNIDSIVGATTSEEADAVSAYKGFNLTLLFVHAWNFIGEMENFHKVRGSLYAAVGGTYASGFLGGLVRMGYEWRLGKHWAVSANVGYRPPATLFIDALSQGQVNGPEFGVGISALF